MYAIIETGGKQYKVEKDDIIKVELLGKNPEEVVEFDTVMLVSTGDDVKIGQPYVAGAKVSGKVVTIGKSPKVTSFKYKNKTNYHRTIGHRQPFAAIKIEAINA